MTVREKLEDDIRASMRIRNQGRVDALRFLKNAIQMVEKNQLKELDEAGMSEVISKQVKDRRESIEMFRQGGRDDLVIKESAELAVLEEYMPPQMPQEELTQIIQDAISTTGATSQQDRGKVMGRVMPQVKGKADGNQVNILVNKLLNSGS